MCLAEQWSSPARQGQSWGCQLCCRVGKSACPQGTLLQPLHMPPALPDSLHWPAQPQQHGSRVRSSKACKHLCCLKSSGQPAANWQQVPDCTRARLLCCPVAAQAVPLSCARQAHVHAALLTCPLSSSTNSSSCPSREGACFSCTPEVAAAASEPPGTAAAGLLEVVLSALRRA